jgi:hypothetical protein
MDNTSVLMSVLKILNEKLPDLIVTGLFDVGTDIFKAVIIGASLLVLNLFVRERQFVCERAARTTKIKSNKKLR